MYLHILWVFFNSRSTCMLNEASYISCDSYAIRVIIFLIDWILDTSKHTTSTTVVVPQSSTGAPTTTTDSAPPLISKTMPTPFTTNSGKGSTEWQHNSQCSRKSVHKHRNCERQHSFNYFKQLYIGLQYVIWPFPVPR